MASNCPYRPDFKNKGSAMDDCGIYGWALHNRGADSKKPPIIFVLGGPGSGKGTQCDLLVAEFSFTHLSTGDLLRDEVNKDTELAVKLKETMDRGELVTSETVLELLKQAIQKNTADSRGFLIDGYPREIDQGKMFEAQVSPVDHVVYFQVRDETMLQRMEKRRESSSRSDDNLNTFVKRLETFHAKNQPIIDYYAKQKKLCKIDAEGSVEEVFSEVLSCLQRTNSDSATDPCTRLVQRRSC